MSAGVAAASSVAACVGMCALWVSGFFPTMGHAMEQQDSLPHPTKLMVISHPDDESLFGGLRLMSPPSASQCRGRWKVMCLTNVGSPERLERFRCAMGTADADYAIYAHEDGAHLHRVHHHMRAEILRMMRSGNFKQIWTHGRKGEYGHLQHKAVSLAVTKLHAAAGGRSTLHYLTTHGKTHTRPAREVSSAQKGKAELLSCYPNAKHWKRLSSKERL